MRKAATLDAGGGFSQNLIVLKSLRPRTAHSGANRDYGNNVCNLRAGNAQSRLPEGVCTDCSARNHAGVPIDIKLLIHRQV
jgi:hypothetical protein